MKWSEYEPYGAKCACGVYIPQHTSVGVDAARLANQSDFIFSFPEKIESTDKKSKYIYSIPYINLIKHVLVQSPVKTTPETAEKADTDKDPRGDWRTTHPSLSLCTYPEYHCA